MICLAPLGPLGYLRGPGTGWRTEASTHPLADGGPEVTRLLTSLAVEIHVSGSTQNQALSALLFLYRQVLAQELPWLHRGVSATQIYTHVLNQGPAGVRSPADQLDL